jgi:hypothetical protein
MNTVGWLLILTAGLALSVISRGRVMNLADDLGDAFLAIVRGDTAGLTEVLKRSGDGSDPAVAATLVGSDSIGVGDPGGKKYDKLGPVKDHVRAAANSIGHQFGVKTIGGWRDTGSVANSDHPKGLALDFMIDDIPNGASVGQRIVEYAILHGNTLGVTYVIWNRRIWRDGNWKAYRGPSPHTDHVHVSFAAKNNVPFIGPVK